MGNVEKNYVTFVRLSLGWEPIRCEDLRIVQCWINLSRAPGSLKFWASLSEEIDEKKRKEKRKT
jgi:hypothetical protein